MKKIVNLTASPEGDSLTFKMEDGDEIVLLCPFLLDVPFFEPTTHVMMTLAASLLHAHQRIAALEKLA